jgi:D-tyrosyl-tRNA(Tyr) deacylase
MRVLLQRVTRAEVKVDDEVTGAIGPGVMALVGVGPDDTAEIATTLANKSCDLRIHRDDEGRTNRSLIDTGGAMLVVSQFTLYGDTRKGRRPSFVHAAHPDLAIPLYERFVAELERRVPGRVATGRFGAMMDVALVNDGPVTLVLER